MKVRLQKFLADAGIASRRAGEEVILEGRVEVNGKVVTELGTKVDPLADRIKVDGRAAKIKRKLYLALNKPGGYICTRSDEGGRPTVYELLPTEWKNVFSVGRLDFNTEGLLFLTNDGDFCLKLTHPRFQVPKIYRAVVGGKVTFEDLQAFQQGVEDLGEILKARRVRLISSSNSRSVVELELKEGKNREVRRMFEARNFQVEKLQRIKIGSIKLGELPVGKWRTLTEPEIKSLLSKL